MPHSSRRRATGFTAAIAIVAALLSPLIAVSAANAADVDGVTGGEPGAWGDKSISNVLTVGTLYQSSFQAPQGHANYGALSAYLIPDGLSAYIVPSTGVVSITGTPTTASASEDIWIVFTGANNTQFSIRWDGFVVSAPLTATTTTVSGADIQNYTNVSVSATVSASAATGTVTFRLGSTVIGSAPVAGGVATLTGPITSAVLGTNTVLSATYSGDATYATSTSTSADTVAIYGGRTLSGTVTSNGEPVASEMVVLQDSGGAATGYSAVTDVNGNFLIILGTPTTQAQVTAQYRLYASTHGVYYRNGATAAQPNVMALADSSPLINSNWSQPLPVFYSVAPTWADQTLAQPRLGEAYSDEVEAESTGTPSTVTYSLTGDPLPSWLTFTNGSFTATNPTDQNPHVFTVVATSAYGSISKQFTLQARNAAVGPTFTDTTLALPVIGAPYSDGVAATGDATIEYTSTPLPAGLTLNSATGAVTGTPTTPGPFSVTFTAENDVDDVDYTWTGTIAVQPSLDVELGFEPGDEIGSVTTDIAAEGLQVGSAYTFTMHSTPRVLYSGVVDASGAFLHTITLPADTPVGAHELILTGVAPDGTVLTAHAWFTVLSTGRIGAISYSGPLSFTLALTGSEPLVPIGIASALLLAGYLALRRSRAVRVP